MISLLPGETGTATGNFNAGSSYKLEPTEALYLAKLLRSWKFLSTVIIRSRSTSETIRIGKEVGSRLQPGDVVALIGELGAGKTHFIKGMASGAGIKKSRYLSSPSFTPVNEYPGRVPFYHIDLYRLETAGEAEDLGIEEYVQGGGITVIEWADRIPSLLPKEVLWIKIEYTGKQSRTIEIAGKGERYSQIVNEIQTSNFNLPRTR